MTDRISPANQSGDEENEETIVRRTLPGEHHRTAGGEGSDTSRMVRQQPVVADDTKFSWHSFAQNPSYPSQRLTYQSPSSPQMLYHHAGLLQRHPPPISTYYPNRGMMSGNIPLRPSTMPDYLPKDRQYLRPRTDPTTAVPNIVIEHVTTVLQQSCHDISTTHTLTPPFCSASSRWSSDGSGPKIRAYSDSAVYELKRHYSPEVTPEEAVRSNVFHFDRPTTSSPMSLSDHPDVSDDDRISDETNDYRTRDASEMAVEDLRRSFLSRTNASSFSDQLLPDAMAWHHSDTARSTVGGLGAENSPKTYWLRRHSDSNTTNEEDASASISGASSLRVETLQVRSLSASDSVIDSTVEPIVEDKVIAERLTPCSSTFVVKSPAAECERLQTPERSKGLMQKRQKLKKYLQARYQSSLDQQAASSTDTDEVFVEKSTEDINREPTDLSPSSRVSTTDLSPTSRITSEISPSTSLEMNRLDEDAVFMYRSSEPLVGAGAGGEYTLRRNIPGGSVRSDVQGGASKELQASATEPERCWPVMSASDQRLMSTISERPVFRHVMKSDTPIFTFPTLNIDAFSENLYPQSFPAVSPLGHHSPIGGPASSSTSRLPSPLIIRKYSSLGGSSSAQSATMSQQRHRVGGSADTNMSVVGRAIAYPGDSSTFTSQLAYDADRRHQALSVADHNVRSSAVSTSAPPSPVAPHIPCSPSYSHLLHPADVMMSAERQTSAEQTQTVFYTFNKMVPQKHPADDTSSSTASSFSCPVCGVALSSYNLLANHMITHLPSEVVSVASSSGAPEGTHVHLCKVCNRSFSRSDMLSRHMRLHTGLRPYECDLCGQVFSRSDHLHTHQRTHTGEKPYHCVHCVYAAPRRDMVTRHMRVHTRDTPSCRGRRSHSASSYPSDTPPGGGGGGGGEDVAHSRTSSSSSCSRGGRARKYKGELPSLRRVSGSQQTERSRIWSLTSSAASTEGSEPSPGGILTPKEGTGRGRGAVSRTWSITSAESSEMFSSPGYATPSAVWSPPVTDSPDVFTSSARQPKHFVWPAVAVTMEQSVVDVVPPPKRSASAEQQQCGTEPCIDEMMIISRSELQ